MTAHEVVERLLEAEDVDDPSMFLRNYADAFERLGFFLDTTSTGQPKWIWQNGPFQVEVVKYSAETAGDDDIPYDLATRAGATDAGYMVWAFVRQPQGDLKNYAHRAAKTEKQAVKLAAHYRKELLSSLTGSGI